MNDPETAKPNSVTPLDAFNREHHGSALDNFVARKRYVESGRYYAECEGEERLRRRIREEEAS